MLIHYERTGGFAGLHLKKTFELDALPASEASEIRDLLKASSFFSLPGKLPSSHPGADRFHYLIEVIEPDRRHKVEFGESAPNEKIQAMVEKLDKLTRRFPQDDDA